MKLNKHAIFSRTHCSLLIVHCSLFIAIGPLFAQTATANAGGVSLEAEIQNIERAVSAQGISVVQKHDALVRLARLRRLSGDIEGAARNWLEAAAATPGQVDDEALLACAYCLAAMGEWDRAAAALEPLLSKSLRARFLSVSINAIRTGNVSGLCAIAENSEYSGMKSEIYFMLWKISREQTAETWRRRLAAEFPQSPEGRLAALGSLAVGSLAEGASTIVVKPSPFWLFAGGIDSLTLMESEQTVPRPPSSLVERPVPATASPSAILQPPPPPSAIQTPAAQTARLQTGLFSREANAASQMAALRQAGFSPSIEQRGEMWAVTVPVGNDQSRSIRELKAAGFDSFPIR